MATAASTLSYAFSSSSRFLIKNNGYSRHRPNVTLSTEEQPCSSSACYQGALLSYGLQKQRVQINCTSKTMTMRRLRSVGRQKKTVVRCSIELEDFIGGDLIKLDLGQWLSDVEEHKALAIYSPHEGGYEGRYLTRLKYQGYHFLDLSARGLGDPETTLTKFHPVCPAHVGKQPIARWYFPPEVDYRLSLLPPNAKGLVVWIIEAKVLSKAELQFLALLPTLRPKVKVIAECGNWRKFMWKPLKEIAGLSQS
ncbi:NAD(P)H-quinone oxidoreductase subunit N, chloroplastic [Nicotiana tomentosiformis]|uniref:NAD(P)H-quinone oxidoreductase subunit N, chloroplastic n=1 Tax=Nicotiana tomentosiformis TaxID=4098 RepID=UPI00051B96CA|nr:NAD(P)H-quinone oxidoreductase subunit N, chloroplastic [Nicotiana tomentosiformis]